MLKIAIGAGHYKGTPGRRCLAALDPAQTGEWELNRRVADKLEELKTMCWCGRKATCNARYDENGIVREGEQVLLGANNNYKALCRKHYKEGLLFPPN